MIFRRTALGLATLTAITLVGCGGGGSSESAAGTVVSFKASYTSDNRDVAGQPHTFSNSEGVLITLNHAFVDLWSVTLQSDCSDSKFVTKPASLLDWVIPTAEAHSETLPNKLSTPNVISSGADALALGSISPAAGNYCGVTIELMRADEDASYLPDSIDMVGKTVYLSGTYKLSANLDPVAFTIETASSLLPAYLKLDAPVALSSSRLDAAVELKLHYQRWFDAVDFVNSDAEALQRSILNNISAALTASTE